MPKLRIQGWPNEIVTRQGQSLLDAALRAGAPLPFNCMNGECGACKCQLISGMVEMGPHNPQALSPHERANGMILSCCSRATSDQLVIRTTTSSPDVAAVVQELQIANHDVMRLRLGFATPPPHFLAGQFARLTFSGLPPRSYSMANPPQEGPWEFHIRKVTGGVVSGHVFERLRVGDELTLQGPYGSACWETLSPKPLLLIAGGTGLAPILSILRSALAAGQPIEALYHGVRAEIDLYDQALLADLSRQHNFRVVSVFSIELSAAPPRRTGALHDAIGHDFASLQGYQIFVAGPPPMVQAVTSLALARGAKANQVQADAFHAQTAPSPQKPPSPPFWKRLRLAFQRTA